MDILRLIDRLDDLVHNAKPVPLTDQVRVDREELYDILDQMRATIPEEIAQARAIVAEHEQREVGRKSPIERIEELRQMRDRNVITSEEYEQHKTRILAGV